MNIPQPDMLARCALRNLTGELVSLSGGFLFGCATLTMQIEDRVTKIIIGALAVAAIQP
jgi:hypothetical protein